VTAAPAPVGQYYPGTHIAPYVTDWGIGHVDPARQKNPA